MSSTGNGTRMLQDRKVLKDLNYSRNPGTADPMPSLTFKDLTFVHRVQFSRIDFHTL